MKDDTEGDDTVIQNIYSSGNDDDLVVSTGSVDVRKQKEERLYMSENELDDLDAGTEDMEGMVSTCL